MSAFIYGGADVRHLPTNTTVNVIVVLRAEGRAFVEHESGEDEEVHFDELAELDATCPHGWASV